MQPWWFTNKSLAVHFCCLAVRTHLQGKTLKSPPKREREVRKWPSWSLEWLLPVIVPLPSRTLTPFFKPLVGPLLQSSGESVMWRHLRPGAGKIHKETVAFSFSRMKSSSLFKFRHDYFFYAGSVGISSAAQPRSSCIQTCSDSPEPNRSLLNSGG